MPDPPITYLTVSRAIMRSWMPTQYPIMVVASSWWNGKRLTRPAYPVRNRPLVCDSGGFLAHQRFGGFPYSLDQLADWALAWQADWCATPDYPCEPELAQGEVKRRLERTVALAAEAIQRRPEVTWRPVLQGWRAADYLQCWELYRQAGITPRAIGTLCRRGRAKEIARVLDKIRAAYPGHTYHLFGVKLTALKEEPTRALADSVDTAAWSMLPSRNRDRRSGWRISAAAARAHGHSSRSRFEWELAGQYYAKLQRLLAAPCQPHLL